MKNRVDYYKYIIKYNKSKSIIILVDTIVVLLSFKVLIQSNFTDLSTLKAADLSIFLILIGSIINFLYYVFTLSLSYKEFNELKYGEVISGIIDVEALDVSPIEQKFHFEKQSVSITENKSELILRSLAVNKHIRANNIIFKRSFAKEVELKKWIHNEKKNLFPFLQWQYRQAHFLGKGFFNEKKFCLASDIIFKEGEETRVAVNKGTYYDTFLTNIISGKEIRSNQDDSLIASAVDYFPKRNIQKQQFLKSITASKMNNEVGVSTLGITSDNYLVLWTQNRSAQSSDGLLVPTGSGSCDWSDRQGTDFKKTIEYAMQRELWEESGKKVIGQNVEEIGKTKILGYYRWMIKGGKPEFVGITKLNCDLLGLTANKSEVYNRYEIEVLSSLELKQTLEEIKNDWTGVSVPLRECVNTILEVLNDPTERLELLSFLGYAE